MFKFAPVGRGADECPDMLLRRIMPVRRMYRDGPPSAQRGNHGVVDIKLSTPGGEDHEFIAAEPHPTAEQLLAGAWSACYITALGIATEGF